MKRVYFLLFLCLFSIEAIAQSEDSLSKHPDFQMLRANENYEYLKDKTSKTFWEKLKYVGKGNHYLSVGGTTRSDFQVLLNEGWEDGNDDKGLLFQRFMAHADWHINQHIRLFGELKSGFAIDRNGEKSPLDTDELDVHQLFIDFRLGKSKLQIGRQELWYGSRRLISIREGTNIRQSFDGVRWIWQNKNHRLDALFFAYNPQKTGFFDNNINTDRLLWGLYHVWNQSASFNLDLYYLGIDNATSFFQEGELSETRHSLGLRHWGKKGNWKFNNEAIFQFGEFGSQNIRAWTISSEVYYKLRSDGLEPTLGLKAEVISGDKTPDDGKLQTFNPLYPRGGYFGLLALIGPANLMDMHPSLGLTLSEKLELNLDWDIFWRYSTEDGIYFPSGRLNVPSGDSQNKFIGHQLGGEIVYTANRFLELEASCFYFATGSFLKEVTDGANIWQLGLSVNFKF